MPRKSPRVGQVLAGVWQARSPDEVKQHATSCQKRVGDKDGRFEGEDEDDEEWPGIWIPITERSGQ